MKAQDKAKELVEANETSKQKAIREAWEELGIEFDINQLDDNGFLSDKNAKYDTWDGRFEVRNIGSHRPKSLDGIEYNESWIKIEKESDLPKEIDEYWVVKNGNIQREYINITQMFDKKYWLENITHYQPITKPKPPLY